ncbi:hypothetical protein A4G28_16250 [Mycobacterium ostraviense]|uniref:Uncharacterized protein n=1 Tax=Mycobacterium ostraviense TaxID=2738409 RepID=A0A164DW58_9MYCO|nr:hypothetical protein A4G28_16250 [Mycobacterium ostraviense]
MNGARPLDRSATRYAEPGQEHPTGDDARWRGRWTAPTEHHRVNEQTNQTDHREHGDDTQGRRDRLRQDGRRQLAGTQRCRSVGTLRVLPVDHQLIGRRRGARP